MGLLEEYSASFIWSININSILIKNSPHFLIEWVFLCVTFSIDKQANKVYGQHGVHTIQIQRYVIVSFNVSPFYQQHIMPPFGQKSGALWNCSYYTTQTLPSIEYRSHCSSVSLIKSLPHYHQPLQRICFPIYSILAVYQAQPN